jgi:WD40 repeat protein
VTVRIVQMRAYVFMVGALFAAMACAPPMRQTLPPNGQASCAVLETVTATPGVAVDSVALLVVSPSGRRLLVSDFAHVWYVDADTGVLLRTLWERASPGDDGVGAIAAFTPDGSQVLLEKRNVLVLLEASTGRATRQFSLNQTLVSQIAVAPDGARFVSSHPEFATRVWDIQSGQVLKEYSRAGYRVFSTAPLAGGAVRLLAEDDAGRVAVVSDLNDSAPPRRIDVGATLPDDARLSPDGRVVASIHNQRDLVLSSAETGAFIRGLPGHAGGRQAGSRDKPRSWLEFSANSQRVIYATDYTVAAWDVTRGVRLPSFECADRITAAALSADGSFAYIARDARVDAWDLSSGRMVERFRSPRSQ